MKVVEYYKKVGDTQTLVKPSSQTKVHTPSTLVVPSPQTKVHTPSTLVVPSPHTKDVIELSSQLNITNKERRIYMDWVGFI